MLSSLKIKKKKERLSGSIDSDGFGPGHLTISESSFKAERCETLVNQTQLHTQLLALKTESASLYPERLKMMSPEPERSY